LRSFQNLKVLDLSGGQFWYLPKEVGDLKHLVSLDLSYCENLENLPDAVRKLHMLKQLNLHACQSLKYLPSGVVGLASLQVLCIEWCSNLIWAEHTASGMARAQTICDVDLTVKASLENICELGKLTELSIFGKIDRGVNLPHNISALTNLKILELHLDNVETLPTEMAYSLKQLQELNLMLKSLKYLPRSFTYCDAFPALIIFRMYYSFHLVEFPEVDEGALPKLRAIEIDLCTSLRTLPLSLEKLPSLETLCLLNCGQTVENCCRINSEKSAIWRKFLHPVIWE
jgi:Leucine-rich repeat (LRR) protein